MKTNSPSYKRKPPNSTSVTNLRLSKRRNSPWKKRIRRWVIENDCINSTTTFIVVIERIWFREIWKSILMKSFQIYNSVSKHHFSSTPTKTTTNQPPLQFSISSFYSSFILIIRKRFNVQLIIIGNNYVLLKVHHMSSTKKNTIFIQNTCYTKQNILMI